MWPQAPKITASRPLYYYFQSSNMGLGIVREASPLTLGSVRLMNKKRRKAVDFRPLDGPILEDDVDEPHSRANTGTATWGFRNSGSCDLDPRNCERCIHDKEPYLLLITRSIKGDVLEKGASRRAM